MLDCLFPKQPKQKPPYLDKIEEYDDLQVIRLKGTMDKSIIPVIDQRIRDNRQKGDNIKKHILLDFKNVTSVDTATIAFHILRIKEYQQDKKKIGFINVNEQLKHMLEMFKAQATFTIYHDEEQAIEELRMA